MDYPRVFIGFDSRETVAYHVLAHSILRTASMPVSITPIALHQLKKVFDRPRHPMQSNDFAFSRWLVPYLCDYKGWAIWMDCDMLVRGDINELWALRDDACSVQVVKHNHVPLEHTKYLGQNQHRYGRKNWSSLMLMNCERCKNLTPEYVGTANGLDIHQFKWLSNDDIGTLPWEWNYLVGYDKKERLTHPVANVHFTTGGPWFEEYKDVEFSNEWRAELALLMHAGQS